MRPAQSCLAFVCRVSARRRLHGRASLGRLLALGAILVVAVTLSSSWAPYSIGAAHLSLATGLPLSQVDYNTPPPVSCNLLNSSYSGVTLPYRQNVSRMFEQVCGSAQFTSIYQKVGAANFTLGYSIVNGTYNSVYFTFQWLAICSNESFGPTTLCAYQEYWVGNLSTNLITGPYTEEQPAAFNRGGGESGAPSFYLPTTIFVSVIMALVAASALALFVVSRRSTAPRESGDTRPSLQSSMDFGLPPEPHRVVLEPNNTSGKAASRGTDREAIGQGDALDDLF